MAERSVSRRTWALPVLIAFMLGGTGCASLEDKGQNAMDDGPQYDRLYVFGDSYSDTGAGYVDGNGPTAVFYMAEKMGIHLYHAHDPEGRGGSLNFAVSGAPTGHRDATPIGGEILGLGMTNQVEDFAERVRSGKIAFDPERTLFFIAGGLNDRAFDTETTLAHLKEEIEILKAAGAEHFTLALLPVAISGFDELTKRLNPAYETFVPEVAKELGIDIRLNHWGYHFDAIFTNPQDYGIVNTTDACAGRAIFDEDTTPCGNPDGYFYYHGGHPSTAVHKMAGEKLFEEIMAWEHGD